MSDRDNHQVRPSSEFWEISWVRKSRGPRKRTSVVGPTNEQEIVGLNKKRWSPSRKMVYKHSEMRRLKVRRLQSIKRWFTSSETIRGEHRIKWEVMFVFRVCLCHWLIEGGMLTSFKKVSLIHLKKYQCIVVRGMFGWSRRYGCIIQGDIIASFKEVSLHGVGRSVMEI